MIVLHEALRTRRCRINGILHEVKAAILCCKSNDTQHSWTYQPVIKPLRKISCSPAKFVSAWMPTRESNWLWDRSSHVSVLQHTATRGDCFIPLGTISQGFSPCGKSGFYVAHHTHTKSSHAFNGVLMGEVDSPRTVQVLCQQMKGQRNIVIISPH